MKTVFALACITLLAGCAVTPSIPTGYDRNKPGIGVDFRVANEPQFAKCSLTSCTLAIGDVKRVAGHVANLESANASQADLIVLLRKERDYFKSISHEMR